MGYPVFSFDGDGLSVSGGDFPDYGLLESGAGSAVPDALPESPVPGAGGDSGAVPQAPDVDVEADTEDGALGTVSGGDTVVFQVPDVVVDFDDTVLRSINDGISMLAAENLYSQGYLSASALDTFDRVVAGLDYRYYAAYRYDNDSYNSVLYLSDSMEVSGGSISLSDALQVRLYRVRSGSSSSTYFYFYATSQVGGVTLPLSGNPMYYTNCLVGYPTLGGVPAPGRYPAWLVLLFGVLFVVLFFSLRRRK